MGSVGNKGGVGGGGGASLDQTEYLAKMLPWSTPRYCRSAFNNRPCECLINTYLAGGGGFGEDKNGGPGGNVALWCNLCRMYGGLWSLAPLPLITVEPESLMGGEGSF